MDVFSAVADPTRRKILALLAIRPASAGVVADTCDDISRPAVSRHLRVLRDAGLVHAEPRGRRQIYTANPAPLAELAAWVESLAPPRFLDSLNALETEVYRTRRERADTESGVQSGDTRKEQIA